MIKIPDFYYRSLPGEGELITATSSYGVEYVSFEYDIWTMKAVNAEVEYLSDSLDFIATAYFNIATYTLDAVLYFSVSGISNSSTVQELCNLGVSAAVQGWDLLLIVKDVGVDLKDLGFNSYS